MLTQVNYLHLLAMLAASIPLVAADAGKSDDIAKSMGTALAQQRQAVASMTVALEAQQHAVQTQLGRQPSSSFFTLPPLPPLPALLVPPADAVADCGQLPASALDALVNQAALREDLEPGLLRRVIRQESAARPCAVSPKGAMGLMQLMPATALQLGVHDAFDPKENVDAGAHFLKQLLRMYGDPALALGAFNAGPARVNEAGGVPDIHETIDYVQKVLGVLP